MRSPAPAGSTKRTARSCACRGPCAAPPAVVATEIDALPARNSRRAARVVRLGQGAARLAAGNPPHREQAAVEPDLGLVLRPAGWAPPP